MTTFIVPVKFDPERPVVYECVEAIRKYHPFDDVFLIDSASSDKSYQQDMITDYGCIIPDLEQKGYGPGAFAAGLAMSDDDFYALIFDSLILHANIDYLKSRQPFTAVRHFYTPPTGWGWDDLGVPLNRWAADQVDFPLPEQFTGIMGPMMFARRSVLDDLREAGFFGIKVRSSFQTCAMERLAGIFLEQLGYDPTCSLQGPMTDFFADFDESVVEKRSLARL